jgi:hypothetical protein
VANTEAGLQNSQDAVDEEDYVGDAQMVAASDTTFPQGNLYNSEHKSVVFKKRVMIACFHVLPEKCGFC